MTSTARSRKMRDGPKPGVGSTGRGLTLNQVLVDWRATVNGTQNAPVGEQQFNPGQRVTLIHDDGTVIVNRVIDLVYSVMIGKRREYINDLIAEGFRVQFHAPPHPIPSEPNTAWVDKEGDFWFTDDEGVFRYKDGHRADWANECAPFTRLVPEGSEREAAIREVVDVAIELMQRGELSVPDLVQSLIKRYDLWDDPEVESRFESGVDR